MIDVPDLTWAWMAATGAVALLVVDVVLSSALVVVSSLHRVALHRMAESDDGLQFAEELASPSSRCHLATATCRQFSLLGAVLLAASGAAALGWSHPAVVAIAAGALIGVIFLEALVAHVVAVRRPRAALKVARPLIRVLQLIVAPLVSPIAAAVERLGEEVQNGEPDGGEDADDEAEAFIEVAERDGILEASEGRMMRGIVDLGDTKVREIMTPRNDILALPAEAPVREALRMLRRANHTRLPVYRDSIDDVVGILHVRDLLRAWEEGRDADSITAFVRPALFFPEVLPVSDLLAQMRTRTHVALAVDEYGGIAGLVTLEDILEEIVGDIRDEHDLEEAIVLKQSDGSWLVSGAAHVDQLENVFGLDVGDEREFDTVGGLVVATVGRVPTEGETLEIGGLRFEVVKADPRRVYRVRVRKLPEPRDSAIGSEG